MRIGVVSDTHDRIETIAEAVRLLAEHSYQLTNFASLRTDLWFFAESLAPDFPLQ
jgi:hypothetical protein